VLKVFGRKEKSASSVAGSGNSYLSNHFSDVRSAAKRTQVANAADAARNTFQKQKELEKLLMKAENEDISMLLALYSHICIFLLQFLVLNCHHFCCCYCSDSYTLVSCLHFARIINWFIFLLYFVYLFVISDYLSIC